MYIGDPEPRAPLHVDYRLTRQQWAVVLAWSAWRPGSSPRIGQKHAADMVRANPAIINRPPPQPHEQTYPRYAAALADIDRWLIFPPQRQETTR